MTCRTGELFYSNLLNELTSTKIQDKSRLDFLYGSKISKKGSLEFSGWARIGLKIISLFTVLLFLCLKPTMVWVRTIKLLPADTPHKADWLSWFLNIPPELWSRCLSISWKPQVALALNSRHHNESENLRGGVRTDLAGQDCNAFWFLDVTYIHSAANDATMN